MGIKGISFTLFFLCTQSLLAQTNFSETALSRTLRQASSLPEKIEFKEVIAATTGHRVLSFDTNNPIHAELKSKLLLAAKLAGKRAAERGISTARANEAGNQLEGLVRVALKEVGLHAEVPTNTLGIAQSAGYPDVAIHAPVPCYLELKTFSSTTEHTTQRTFYYSPSARPKVTRDAVHLLLAFELRRETRDDKTVFAPVRWKLISLERLLVELKLEFNQNNRGLYGPDGTAVLSEGEVSEGD